MSRKSEDAMGMLICGLNRTGKSALGRILADRPGYEFIANMPCSTKYCPECGKQIRA